MNDKHFLEHLGWFNPQLYYLTLTEHINCLMNLNVIFEYKSEYYRMINDYGYSKIYNDLSIRLDVVIDHLLGLPKSGFEELMYG